MLDGPDADGSEEPVSGRELEEGELEDCWSPQAERPSTKHTAHIAAAALGMCSLLTTLPSIGPTLII